MQSTFLSKDNKAACFTPLFFLPGIFWHFSQEPPNRSYELFGGREHGTGGDMVRGMFEEVCYVSTAKHGKANSFGVIDEARKRAVLNRLDMVLWT
jgi:hypothetical protein